MAYPTRISTLNVPIFCPYMWYQNRTHLPFPVTGMVSLITMAFSSVCRGHDDSMKRYRPVKNDTHQHKLFIMLSFSHSQHQIRNFRKNVLEGDNCSYPYVHIFQRTAGINKGSNFKLISYISLALSQSTVLSLLWLFL